MWRRPASFVICVCAFLAAARSNGSDTANNWNLPRFASEGAELYRVASQVTPAAGTDVIVLDDEESYVFDVDGKAVHTQYLVYKVLTQKGTEGWDAISREWQPWHEEKPTMRARVVTADGTVHPLDPKTITDSPARDEDEKTYGEGREVRAPLPAIEAGSVVEEEEIITEKAPLSGSGIVRHSYLGGGVPTQRSLLVLDVPASLPLRYAAQLLPNLKTQKTEANGRAQLVFEEGPLEAWEEAEDYVPKDVPVRPAVNFSTGVSWQSVAEEYGKIVDGKANESEVRSIVAKVIAGKTKREDKAAAIQEFLSREIRYTGVEFGDAAIVPHPPAETFKQKYGDCKDKATLAVAMLRSAGVPAYVALLNTGTRQDVPPDLPGLGLFDHAIVYAPGSPDIWIDATDEYARLGQLPIGDQGRAALVARAETTGLITVPESSSQENRIVEKREFYLAENGPARVVETTEPHGTYESGYRATYADAEDKDRKKNLTDYLGSEYVSTKLTRMERSDPRDLHKQFQLVLEAAEAKRGFTDLESAAAAIRLDSLFNGLPDELQQREKQPEKGAVESKDPPKKPRTADYQLPESFVRIWEYKIVPPIGFQAKPLPQNVKTSLGPAILTEEFSTESDGSVRAVLQLDTVKRRLTVAEATELRTKVAQMRDGPAVLIYFESTTQALMNQGKMREAFRASRELIGQHPKEAVHHLQRAKVLLAAGLGETAREEAKLATRLEPNSALAKKTLAEILEYDVVGRQFRRGSDYAAAEAAFRAAVRIDPTDHAAAANLAILLEYNTWGLRYGPGARLKDAIAEYRNLGPEALAELGAKNNLAFALFYDRDFAESKESAESLNPQPVNLIVACESALDGAPSGLAEARKRTSGEAQFKQVVSNAGQLLENLRIYPLAADLLESGASGENAAGINADAGLLRKTELHERLTPPDTPVGAALRFYLLQAGPSFTLDELRALCSRNGELIIGTTEALDSYHKEETSSLSRKSRSGLFADVGFDLSVTRAQPKVEGDDTLGNKVTFWSSAQFKYVIYLVKEGGQYKVVADTGWPAGVGLEALDRAEAGDLAAAKVLLDWLREDQHLAGGDDPLTSAPFPRLWTKGQSADGAAIKLAAASELVPYKQTAARGIAVFEQALDSVTDENQRTNIELALSVGYRALEQYDKALTPNRYLVEKYPESRRGFLGEAFLLRVTGHLDEAIQLEEGRLRRMPNDVDAVRELNWSAIIAGDYEKAHALDQKLLDAGRGEAGDLNDLAWHALFTGRVLDSDVEAVLKAAQLNQNNAGTLHTLGCVYAEVGKTKEARDVLIQAMDKLALDEPDDNYWYAFGRIAEQYGEYDAARADYNRVAKPKRPIEVYSSSYSLAQMRLAAMKGEAQK